MSRTLSLSYYPWITQNLPDATIRAAIQKFADLIRDELRKKKEWSDVSIPVLDPLEVPAQMKFVQEHDDIIALMNPLGYLFANQKDPKIEAVALAIRVIGDKAGGFYFS